MTTDNNEYNRGYNEALDNVRRLLFDAGKDAFGWKSSKGEPIINDVLDHLKALTVELARKAKQDTPQERE